MFYGQHHEDVFIKTIFPNTNNGVCIEVGASDGISGSNTKHFEDIGWKSLCIEPISSNFEKCKTIRKDCYQCCISDKDKEDTEFTIFHLNENLSAISSLEPDHRLIESHSHLITDTTKIKVKVRSLNSLLEELQFPKNIDFISIDTENTELDVLKGIDLNVYNVTLLVVENNYDEPFCEDYLSQYGYKKIKRIAVNDFYLKEKKYTHYHGEIQQGKAIDEVLASYFPIGYKGVFFDIGAYEPVNISNSYHFEMNGWETYCFEANTLLIKGLKSQRKNVYNYAISDKNKDSCEFNVVRGPWGGGSLMAGLSAIDLDPDYMNEFSKHIHEIIKITVPQKTLNSVIETEIKDLVCIDIMSIDVEGGELNVLKGLDLNKYKPKILVIENIFNKPDIYDYLKKYNYTLDKRIDYNEYYKLNIDLQPCSIIKMKVEVSIGEAIDKLSILEIKLIKISDKNKKIKVQKEINCLQECVIYKTKYEYYYNLLMYVNNKIWNLTDVIKKIASSDPQFANISKQIFEFNQQRFRIKNWFNLLTGSNINEQKSYELSHCKIVIESEDIFFNKLPEIYFLALEYDVITFDTSDILDISIISNCLKIPTIIYDNEQKKLLCNPTIIIISNFYILENELKAAFSLKPITYIVGGLLGDFIQSLSVICETYYQTGRKGILYISERGHGFRNGLENTYNEIYQYIIGQKYIQDFKIYNNEPFEIDLSQWRSSPLLFHQNWHHIYKQIYNVEWGKRPWLIASYDEKWKDKIVINTTNYRWPINIEFKKLNELYPNEMVFISFDREQYIFFERTASISIEYYEPKSFLEMVTIINSCKLFVGSLSSPLSIANALHKDRICGLCSSIADNNHNLHLENVFPNIRYSV